MSIYAPDSPYTVYCSECFWGDRWNPLISGKEFDFSRSFFPQFLDLTQEIPLISLINVNTENSEYCNRIYDGRNNYLSFVALFAPENLYHTYYTVSSKDCTDITYCQHCELCYELIDCEHCYGCNFGRRLKNCKECFFCEDCSGCTDCYRCKNLHQQTYCIENKQYTREEYKQKLAGLNLGSFASQQKEREEAAHFFLTLPSRAAIRINCENVVGANVYYCRECHEIYDFYESEHMRYCTLGEKSHHCMDCFGFGQGEFCYECINFLGGNSNCFCIDCPTGSDMLYSYSCFNDCSHCFGCVSLKKACYCIFNKQYSESEYADLAGKIALHMKNTGEWGQFFPSNLSFFGYNETCAKVYTPLERLEALKQGFRWCDPDAKEYLSNSFPIPGSIKDVTEDITKEILACSDCGKNYKVIPQELAFYRSRFIPVPRQCPDCRHDTRMQMRAPALLWKRECANCTKQTDSTYAPERPEIVYCEECYLQAVY